MVNIDDDPRKRRDPFEDLMRNLGMDPKHFEDMFDNMQEALSRMIRDLGPLEPGKPYMHGFSFKLGPDGKPVIDQFGNRPQRGQAGKVIKMSEGREPLTDVIESDTEVTITMEIPGVTKEDIDMRVTETEVVITVDTESRKYNKTLKAPSSLKPDTTKATYKNGILDVVIKKKTADRPPKGFKVNVE